MSAAQSGRYQYLLNGEPAPVEETWRCDPREAGIHRVQSGRRAGDVAIDVDAEVRDARVVAFTVAWREAGTLVRSVEYTLHDRLLHVARRDGHGVVEETEASLGQELTLLFPLMRIFTGAVIDGLLRGGGAGVVVVPNITVPPGSPDLLLPQFSQRRAEVAAEESLEDDSGVSRPCRRCEYLGGQYDEDACFWLGPEGLLERYQWRQDENRFWSVSLQRDG